PDPLDGPQNFTFTPEDMRAFARAAVEADRARQWISCAERMPEPEVEVLVYGTGTIGTQIGQWFRGRWDDHGWNVEDDGTVTHWMPLPAPPVPVR
ncbi:MAG TPA: DUF551 domain-containing protein, partial [Burkholderiaceae bacterium]|nr:DUF551 domain-containing protein [Burkholderiaceae bacterium]